MSTRWGWPIAAFALWHYAVVLALALLAYSVGRTLTARCRYESTLERAVFCTALGLGAVSYLVFALGLIGLLAPAPVAAALGVLALGSRRAWPEIAAEAAAALRGRRGRGGGPRRWLAMGATLGGAAVLLPLLLLPLYPPTHWDATLYHLALAKRYAAAHRVAFAPELRFALFPQLNEMLFTVMLVVADDIGAQLTQTLMAALLAAAVWAWGRRLGSARTGAWAAALLLANPIVIWLGSSAYIDVGVTLFGALACYGFWRWCETSRPDWLLLSGVFCGFAAASKYSALFWLVLLGAAAVYRVAAGRAPGRALITLALGAAAGLPWYLRSAYYSGNPVFPFFPEIFGHRYWSLEDIRAMLLDVGASYGVGRTLSGLVALPWHLAFNQDLFHSERHLTAFYLFVFPAALVAAALRPAARWVTALAATFTVWWFFTSQELRYLVPALPFYSLAAAAGAEWLLRWLPPPRRLRHGLAILVGAFLLLPGWRYVTTRVLAQGPVPATAAERDAFLTRALPAYPAYRFLNMRRGTNYTVYALYNENMTYFSDGKFEGDWFGPARYSRILSRIGSSRDLYAELRSLGADYLLISDWRRVSLPVDRFFYAHFRRVFTAGSTWLFELVPPAGGEVSGRPTRRLPGENGR